MTPPRDRLRAVLPRRDQLGKDAVARVPGAIASVPDGMAASVLVGVSPIHGLIASFIGPIAGGLTASTALMVIATMGFLTGVALNIIFGQIPDLSGTTVEGESAFAKALAVVTDPQSIDGASLLIGLAATVILVGLKGTRLGSISSLIAVVIPTAFAALATQAGGRVFLSGVDPALHKQYGLAGQAAVDDAIEVFEATPIVNESSRQAYARATDWLAQPDQDNETP